MATLLRLLLTAGLIYGLVQVNQTPLAGAGAGGLSSTVWMGVTLALAVAAAAAWAPVVVGRLVSNPLTDPLSGGTDSPEPRWRLIRWGHARGHGRLVRWLCFLAGVRRPWLPLPFVFGLINSTPGSRLEQLFAAELLRSKTAFEHDEARRLLLGLAGEGNPHRSPLVSRLLEALALNSPPSGIAVPTPAKLPPTPTPSPEAGPGGAGLGR